MFYRRLFSCSWAAAKSAFSILKPPLEVPPGPASMPKCSVQLQLQKWAPPDTHSWLWCDAEQGLPFLSEAQCLCRTWSAIPEAAQAGQCCRMEVPWPGLEGSGSIFGCDALHRVGVTAVVPLTREHDRLLKVTQGGAAGRWARHQHWAVSLIKRPSKVSWFGQQKSK